MARALWAEFVRATHRAETEAICGQEQKWEEKGIEQKRSTRRATNADEEVGEEEEEEEDDDDHHQRQKWRHFPEAEFCFWAAAQVADTNLLAPLDDVRGQPRPAANRTAQHDRGAR